MKMRISDSQISKIMEMPFIPYLILSKTNTNQDYLY